MTTTSSKLDRIFELDLSECEVTVCLGSASKDEVLPRFERLLLSAELTETFRSVAAYTLAQYTPLQDLICTPFYLNIPLSITLIS